MALERAAVVAYLLAKPGSRDCYPFGEQWQVFKVKDKMFAVVAFHNGRLCANLKCDPAEAQMLRDIFLEVEPGYHMNKRHWNTVYLDGTLPEGEVQRMIDNSWSLVVKNLKKADRQQLALLAAATKDRPV